MADDAPRAADLFRSFAGKMALLLVIFLVFPALVYVQLAAADRARNDLLIQSIQREGELIARSLRPVLEGFETASPDDLQEALDRLRIENRTIKVLARPDVPEGPPQFYYIAASPEVARQRLDEERTMLLATGLLDQLSDTCDGNRPLATRFVNPDGEAEILSSLAPVRSGGTRFVNPDGEAEILSSLAPVRSGGTCFVIIASHTGPEILETALGRPFWRTETAQIAALIYVLMAVIVVWLFAIAWRNLRRFQATARMIRIGGPGAGSFATRNRIPELSTVAEDIDRLVEDLDRSRQYIRDAAEETAHALKAPLAVMSQALEPLKRAVGDDGQQARRCLALLESSIGRMDAMISATRDLERLVAETLEPGKQPVNLGSLVEKLGEAYEATLAGQRIRLEMTIAGDVYVLASDEALETIFENVLDNAISFAPAGSRIAVVVQETGERAVVEIADEGPGVDPKHVEDIFERYVSLRDGGGETGGVRPTTSFGIGLWLVRRNVEALGGRVAAANRSPRGLRITISLPLSA